MKKKQEDPAKKLSSKCSKKFLSLKRDGRKSEEKRCKEMFQTYVGDSIAIENIFAWHL